MFSALIESEMNYQQVHEQRGVDTWWSLKGFKPLWGSKKKCAKNKVILVRPWLEGGNCHTAPRVNGKFDLDLLSTLPAITLG